MSKIQVHKIEVKNPKDNFLSNIEVEVLLEAFETLKEGYLTRIKFYGYLCWLCR